MGSAAPQTNADDRHTTIDALRREIDRDRHMIEGVTELHDRVLAKREAVVTALADGMQDKETREQELRACKDHNLSIRINEQALDDLTEEHNQLVAEHNRLVTQAPELHLGQLTNLDRGAPAPEA